MAAIDIDTPASAGRGGVGREIESTDDVPVRASPLRGVLHVAQHSRRVGSHCHSGLEPERKAVDAGDVSGEKERKRRRLKALDRKRCADEAASDLIDADQGARFHLLQRRGLID